ncbi:MAG TPA: peptidoglycan-binding protein [Acidimicrobiales bacterium]|nr:peptidoglycan-binding protein [Acidimicrobiales bacterium]
MPSGGEEAPAADSDLPLTEGATGEAVRDLQRRLRALDLDLGVDTFGYYGPGTSAAVRAFQDQRGLRVDGICDRNTWASLVEAGRILGERLLYYRKAMLKGDDVATLQRQLGALGFDAGRPDGIFGPETHDALCEFQRNVGLTEDGICGPTTVQYLRRYTARVTGSVLVAGIRERVKLSDAPRTLRGWRVAVGEAGGLAALAEATRRVLRRAGADVLTLHDPDESAHAAQANAAEVDVYVGLRLEPGLVGCRSFYFQGHRGYASEAGRNLARLTSEAVAGRLQVPAMACRGMGTPLLRETRMPAIVIEIGPPSLVVRRTREVADAITEGLDRWVGRPFPE